MLEICVATNFDDNLIEQISKYGPHELYGKLKTDCVGGGRPAWVLPEVDWERVRRHIRIAHKHSTRFNYLLNAVTLGSREAKGYREIRRLMDTVADVGADAITVTDPLLLMVAKRYYPQFEVKISIFAGVATPVQAKLWADLGADVISPAPTLVNREFSILKSIADAFQGPIQLVANNNCIMGCPFTPTHNAFVSQASRSQLDAKKPMVDYCMYGCRLMRLTNPELMVKGDWIRPEDLEHYERVGVKQIKIVDRSCSTSMIVKRVKAYTERRYDGNLFDIMEQAMIERKRALEGSRGALAFYREPVVSIPNRKLDGFIDHFVAHSCMQTDCLKCGYCSEVAARVVRIDKGKLKTLSKRYLEEMGRIISGVPDHHASHKREATTEKTTSD